MQKTIGIPRALLYYKYHTLWTTFLETLGFKLVVSSPSTKETLEKGRNYLVDEACLSMKIYMGHLDSLKGKCDYILVPRITCIQKHEKMCTNFYALYDLVKNLFEEEKIIHYNIDIEEKETEFFAFLKLGQKLHKTRKETIKAYQKAKQKEEEKRLDALDHQKLLLRQSNIKILLVGHPYNLYDKQIGGIISEYLKKEKVTVLYSDRYDTKNMNKDASFISPNMYWTFNKEIIASLYHYHKKVDGIILLSTFPCGPDSLANEMCVRKITSTPITTIIMDELNSEAGLTTRLESFLDIIKERKKKHEQPNH